VPIVDCFHPFHLTLLSFSFFFLSFSLLSLFLSSFSLSLLSHLTLLSFSSISPYLARASAPSCPPPTSELQHEQHEAATAELRRELAASKAHAGHVQRELERMRAGILPASAAAGGAE
jgi:hypothetical protein